VIRTPPSRSSLASEGVDRGQTVFVVDDDEAVRKAIAILLNSIGLRVETFASATDFLDSYRAECEGWVAWNSSRCLTSLISIFR